MTISTGSTQAPADLAAAAFSALADEFFGPAGRPVPFKLRDKRQTQDDPFDEHVGEILKTRLAGDIRVFVGGSPLVSPDMVLARAEETRALLLGGVEPDSRHVLAIEVKKLNSDGTHKAARASGMDYNSTPPCETVKIEADNGRSMRVPATYLFVELVDDLRGAFYTRSLALVAGSALNEDTALYDRITGIRQKQIGLGTYGDGLDRQRPMLVFANPLGWTWLQGHATLIHPNENLASEQPIEARRTMTRVATDQSRRTFTCYRPMSDAAGSREVDVTEPFPRSQNRKTETSQRGKFRISLAAEK